MTVSTTYTMLVTIAHDEGAAPSTDLLEVMVQRGLEEGTKDFAGVYSAEVDSIKGDLLQHGAKDMTPEQRARTTVMRNTHISLRED